MKHLLCLIVAWLAVVPVARGQIFPPMLHSASPCAVQVGTTAECLLAAAGNGSANGAFRVLVSGKGVTGEIIPPLPGDPVAAPCNGRDFRIADGQVRARFTVAPDAPLGIRDVRILAANGSSSLGQIVVVRDPIVREVNPNNSMEQAQRIPVPATVCGTIESKEDVDFYKFKVEAGVALTFHVWCQRLQNKLAPSTYHADPMITLRNATGSVLAANDNFFGGDPLLHYRFGTGGDYYLEVRDVRYHGYRSWEYALEVHDRPFATTISPACLPLGVPTKVRVIGCNLSADPFVTVTLPADAPSWDQWHTLPDLAGRPLNAVLVRPSALPIVREAATPNDNPAQAQRIALPAAVAGVLERSGDVDCYAFEARKGERITLQIAAHPLNSELDSVLRILDARGETLAENDDASDKSGHREARNEILCADSRIENWEAPADGRFVIEVSDVHGRGGERFTYSLLVRPSRPHFLLELSTDKTVLAPGSVGVIFVRSARKEGFTGDVQLAVDGLPPGVTAVCGSIPGPCQDGCILLRAGWSQTGRFSNIRVTGTATVQARAGTPPATLTVVAQPYEELMRDGGARYLVPVDSHVVATVTALDLKAVRFTPSDMTLQPGETKKVEVTIERRQGFKDPVTLSLMSHQHVWVYGNCLPPGVTLDAPASQLRLTGDQLTGTIVLKAAANAVPVRRQLVPILGEVGINFPLRMYFAGDPFWLTVETAAGKK